MRRARYITVLGDRRGEFEDGFPRTMGRRVRVVVGKEVCVERRLEAASSLAEPAGEYAKFGILQTSIGFDLCGGVLI